MDKDSENCDNDDFNALYSHERSYSEMLVDEMSVHEASMPVVLRKSLQEDIASACIEEPSYHIHWHMAYKVTELKHKGREEPEDSRNQQIGGNEKRD